MFRNIVRRVDKRGIAALALLSGGAIAFAADSVDQALAGWLGKEIQITTTTLKDEIPLGGRLTLTYDSAKDVVRVCTKQDATQQKSWSGDLATSCGVVLTFTRGTRYCTDAEVKTGNSETLASCHRLRSSEVALSPTTAKGAELSDVIIFLVQGENGKHNINIMVDSPSRVTAGGNGTGTEVGGNGGG